MRSHTKTARPGGLAVAGPQATPSAAPLVASEGGVVPAGGSNQQISSGLLHVENSWTQQDAPSSPGVNSSSPTAMGKSQQQQRMKKVKSHHSGGKSQKGVIYSSDVMAQHARRVPLTAQPFFRIRVIARQVIFVVKMIQKLHRVRSRQHYVRVVMPRAAFIMQCCIRRFLVRKRMRHFSQLMVLRAIFLPKVMKRVLKFRHARAVLARITAGYSARHALHRSYQHVRVEGATGTLQRFVRAKIATRIRDFLELDGEERSLLFEALVAATVAIFRAERQSLNLLVRESNQIGLMVQKELKLTRQTQVASEEIASEANILPPKEQPQTARERRESLALAIDVFSSGMLLPASLASNTAARKGVSDVATTNGGVACMPTPSLGEASTAAVESSSFGSPQLGGGNHCETPSQGLDSDSETTATGSASPTIQIGGRSNIGSFFNRSMLDQLPAVLAHYDHDAVSAFVRDHFLAPSSTSSFGMSSPHVGPIRDGSFSMFRLVTKPSGSSFCNNNGTSARTNQPNASGFLMFGASQQGYSSGSFMSQGSLYSGSGLPDAGPMPLQPASLEKAASQSFEGDFGSSRSKSKRKMSYRFRPLSDVQKAFAALLGQTESLERKELIRQYNDEAHIISAHIEWYFTILDARMFVHSLLMPILPQLEPLWILKRGLALLKAEGEGRARIEHEYASMPLHFLNRPMLDKKAEYRREQIRAKLMRESSFAKMTRRTSEQIIPALRQSLSMANRRRVSSISMVPRPPDVARKSSIAGDALGTLGTETINVTANYFARRQQLALLSSSPLGIQPVTSGSCGDSFNVSETVSIEISSPMRTTANHSAPPASSTSYAQQSEPSSLVFAVPRHPEHLFGPVLSGSPGETTLRVSAPSSRTGSFFYAGGDNQAAGSFSLDGPVNGVDVGGGAVDGPNASKFPTIVMQPRSSSGHVIPADFYAARAPSVPMPQLGGRKLSMAEANAMFPSKRQQQLQLDLSAINGSAAGPQMVLRQSTVVPGSRSSSSSAPLISFGSPLSSVDPDDEKFGEDADGSWRRRSSLSAKDYEHRKRNSVVETSSLRGSLLGVPSSAAASTLSIPRPSAVSTMSSSTDSARGFSIAIPEVVDHSEYLREVPKSESCGADLCNGRSWY